MISDTTKQQRGVLLIALLGFARINPKLKPERKRILAFIRIKNLIAWNEHEIELSDANCSVGENRISWRRKDFVNDGLLETMEYGVWKLTEEGLTKTENIVKEWKEKFEKNPNFFREIKDIVPELKLTDEFMNLVLQLAQNNFQTKFYPPN
jgi:hypothetical protein